MTSVWTMASTEPTTRVRVARAHTTGRQSSRRGSRPRVRTRMSPANPAALAAAAMKPVTGDGEPW